MSALNYQEYFGVKLEISLAKPPSGKTKKEEMLRKREQRMIQTMAERLVKRSLPWLMLVRFSQLTLQYHLPATIPSSLCSGGRQRSGRFHGGKSWLPV